MKVKIDRGKCIECGACAEACPIVFVFNKGEKAKIAPSFQLEDESMGVVKEHLKECVSKASRKCPINIISVV